MLSVNRFLPHWRFLSSVALKASALKKPKRFYEKVEVREVSKEISSGEVLVNAGSVYGVFLDERLLRTPLGKQFCAPESLALAVAQEWESQVDVIRMEAMLLTGLSFTSIDNPCQETNASLVNKLLSFLQSDTLLYFADPMNTLSDVQRKNWTPIIQFVNHRFGLSLSPVDSAIAQPELSFDTLQSMERHLLGLQNTFPALIGILYGTEAIKSLLVVLATLAQHLDVDTAVRLSRLEQIHQTEVWGNVEWAHDVEHNEQCTRLAAAVLFSRLCSSASLTSP